MNFRNGMSRRHVLAMSAAATSLAIGGGFRRASAQATKRIERYAPELDGIIETAQPIQELASGTGGALGPTEGPVWWKEGGYLLYSDIHGNRRMKYVPGQGATVFKEPTHRANGLTRDVQGRLVACERDTRRVGDRRRRAPEPVERRVAAVSGKELTSCDDDGCADDGQPDDEVPRRRRLAQVIGKVGPQPVLDVVHEREEERRKKRCGNPDECPEQDQPQVRGAGELLGLRRRAHAGGRGFLLDRIRCGMPRLGIEPR